MIILSNQKTKEAYQVVELILDNGCICEFTSGIYKIDFFGLYPIQYKLFNMTGEIKRHLTNGWSWDSETRNENSTLNFNNNIQNYVNSLVKKGFEIEVNN